MTLSISILTFVLVLVDLITVGFCTNLLCKLHDWSFISDDWVHNEDECSVTSKHEHRNSIIWFDSSDGKTPNEKYIHESFILETEIEFFSAKQITSHTAVVFGANSTFDQYAVVFLPSPQTPKNSYCQIYTKTGDSMERTHKLDLQNNH